jgi:glycosyltransferase 2 family protein
VVMAQVWSILAAFILLGVDAFVSHAPGLPGYAPLLVLLVPLGLVITYPPIMEKLANRLLKWLKKEPVHLKIHFGESLIFLLRYLGSWFVYGAAFFVFLISLHTQPLRHFPAITSIFATSYTLGFLCLIVPGGLGIREGLLTALLSGYMPLPMATVVSLLSRIWFTAGELVCLGLAFRL